MGKSHIHQHAEIRSQNRLDGRHFTRGRDACFKHTDLTPWCSCKNGQRHPHLTVPAARAGRHPELGRQAGSQGIFDHCLAIAAGDCDHLGQVLGAVPGRQHLKGQQGIFHLEPGNVHPTHPTAHEDEGRTGPQGCWHEAMTILLMPLQGHKEITWLDPARIDRHTTNRDLPGGITQLSTDDSGQIESAGQGHRHWGRTRERGGRPCDEAHHHPARPWLGFVLPGGLAWAMFSF